MDHKHDQTTPWKLFPFAGTVIKNLFSKPCTTGYPFEPAQYPESDARPCGNLRGGTASAAVCAPTAARPARCRWTGPPVPGPSTGSTVSSAATVSTSVPKSALPLCRLHGACRTEGQRDLYPAQGTGCRAGGQGRRQAGERCRQVRLLHPLRQKMSPERHHGGPRFQDLETGRSSLRWLRPVRPPPVPRMP